MLVLLGYSLGASWHRAERWVGAASLVLGSFLLFCLVLVWAHRVVVRHEQCLLQKWHRTLRSPLMLRFRRRFAPAIAFVQARMSPNSYLGAQLTAGAFVLLAAGWLFGGIAEDVATNDPLTKIDVLIAHWLHDQVTTGMAHVMLGVSAVSGPLAITLYVVTAAFYLMYRREWYWLTSLLVAVPAGILINTLMKLAFHRARPSLEHPIISLASYSFPSGHAAGATLFFGVLASYLICHVRSWSWRVAIFLFTVVVVMVVSFSRMYLGAHYLSDVLGGIAEGVAWLSFCLAGIHTFRRHHAAHLQYRHPHQEAKSR